MTICFVYYINQECVSLYLLFYGLYLFFLFCNWVVFMWPYVQFKQCVQSPLFYKAMNQSILQKKFQVLPVIKPSSLCAFFMLSLFFLSFTRESEIPSKKLRMCPLPPLKFSCVPLEFIVTWISELILLVNTGVRCITRNLRSCYLQEKIP